MDNNVVRVSLKFLHELDKWNVRWDLINHSEVLSWLFDSCTQMDVRCLVTISVDALPNKQFVVVHNTNNQCTTRSLWVFDENIYYCRSHIFLFQQKENDDDYDDYTITTSIDKQYRITNKNEYKA
jgi:hypothetical protein